MDQRYRAGTVEEGSDTTTDRFGMGERFPEITDEVTEVSGNIETVIQRYPWPTLLVGIVIGYLVARRIR